jgi:mono/diheme cytochrome c family protein
MVEILKIAGLVIGVGVVAFALYVSWAWDRTWDVPLPELHASTDPAIIARGEALVLGPAHCVACHVGSPAEFVKSVTGTQVPLAGGFPFKLGPIGTLYTGNLTPDRETGIGRYTDPQIARMLRHGVRPDGVGSIPLLMPFGEMSDDDVVAILSYLRAQPPVRRVVPANEWTVLGKVIKSFAAVTKPLVDVNPPRTAPPSAPTVERGRYLALSVANCVGCHSPIDEMTGRFTGPRLTGALTPQEPAPFEEADMNRWFLPPNITPLKGSALMRFPDCATFVARFKFGGRKHPGSTMPWELFSRMSEEDLGAICAFLLAEPPSGSPAPEDPTVPAPGS